MAEPDGYRIRNWSVFQHYNKPRPAWIKLHRRLLDDRDFHALSIRSRHLLVMLWLLAAESESGTIPAAEGIAWRLRIPLREVVSDIQGLTMYLEPVYTESRDNLFSDRDRDRDRDREKHSVGSPPTVRFLEEEFEKLWKAHPYGSKAEARKAYRLALKDAKVPIPSELLAVLDRQVAERKQADANGDFIARLPHLCRWFKHKRWEDEPHKPQTAQSEIKIKKPLTEEERESFKGFC